MLRWICLMLAVLYFWLYPAILLVPQDFRQSFWSLLGNVPHRGIVVSLAATETAALFRRHVVHRVAILEDGRLEHFWVANTGPRHLLIPGELVSFETRGGVIVLAHSMPPAPAIISLLNY